MEPVQILKPQVIVFDVYDTLLNMSEIERTINQITESKRGYVIWFELFMQYCFANNFLDHFHNFISIAGVTLEMTGRKLGRAISEAEADKVIELLKHLPLHEGVPSCLSELNDLDFTIIALTNAPEKIVCDRMERTGLISYFEHVLSAETVKKYKPERKVYEWAAQKLGVDIHDMLMVTTHAWDIAGAQNAGMKTAFLKRNNQLLYPLVPAPDIISNDLSGLVKRLQKVK